MSLTIFEESLSQSIPPSGYSIQLQALWWDAKGEWEKAHQLIDHLEDLKSAHVHAYLHRVEGDLWNARYWYSRAKQPEYKGTLKDESLYLVGLYL